MNTTHPIIAGHVEFFDELEPLTTGPLDPETPADDDLAPLVTSDDYEFEDLAWHRGNDWLMESDRAEIEFGVRSLFR